MLFIQLYSLDECGARGLVDSCMYVCTPEMHATELLFRKTCHDRCLLDATTGKLAWRDRCASTMLRSAVSGLLHVQRAHCALLRGCKNQASAVVHLTPESFCPDLSQLHELQRYCVSGWAENGTCSSALVHEQGYLLMTLTDRDPLGMVSKRHGILFIFVEEKNRRQGVATRLLAELDNYNTHAMTEDADGDALLESCGFSRCNPAYFGWYRNGAEA